MTDDMMTNSAIYWNYRFAENWEACNGPAQSKHFAKLTIEHLPHWLIDQLKRKSLTLADWGCAQGDGTDVWASYIGAEKLTGIDFSQVAIEKATHNYRAIRFINEDWLAEGDNNIDVFDVVYTSNTLEHFYKPYDVLQRLCFRAKKAIILALPYREIDRIDEHFFSFQPENLLLVLPNGFRLAWSKVVDCRQLPDTPWGGDQIFLVYANPEWLDGLGLTLSDCYIGQDDIATEIKQLKAFVAERNEQIANLSKVVAERDIQVQELAREVVRQDEHAQALAREIAEKDRRAQELALELMKERSKTIWQRVKDQVKRR